MVADARPARFCVLIIAGLDPSGGAGLAADQRAILATGTWPCPVCATITVQSTAGLVSAHPVDPALLTAQATEVLRHERVRAIKTGALGNDANVQATCDLLRAHRSIPAVVDPVLIATRSAAGARLLDSDARRSLGELLHLATVATPNTDEASEILGKPIRDEKDLEDAARELCALGPRAALIKGGHLPGDRSADVLHLAGRSHRFTSRRLPVPEFHGGGCTMASLIAGKLASTEGKPTDAVIVDAVRSAKRRLSASIRAAVRVGDGLLVLPM